MFKHFLDTTFKTAREVNQISEIWIWNVEIFYYVKDKLKEMSEVIPIEDTLYKWFDS